MAGFLLPSPRFSATTATGAPLVGGKLYTYEAGTDTPLPAYHDAALTIPHTNPIILDSRGEATIFIPDGEPYRLVLTDADDVEIWDQDDVEIPSITVPPPSPTAIPAGTIVAYGAAVAPSGWLLADGSQVSRTVYADLFAAIGVTFGPGDSATTFHLPDLRGRFPLGKAAAGTGATLGSTGGALDHTHSTPAVAAHTHGVTVDAVAGHTHSLTTSTVNVAFPGGAGAASTGSYVTGSGGGHTHTASTAAAGAVAGSAPGPANPPFLALNFLVKV